PAIAGHLKLPGAEVVETCIAEDPRLGHLRCDILELCADDHRQLAFPVEMVIARWDGNGLGIARQGRAPACKNVGMLRHLKLCFLNMGEIVHTRAKYAG